MQVDCLAWVPGILSDRMTDAIPVAKCRRQCWKDDDGRLEESGGDDIAYDLRCGAVTCV